MSRLYSVSPEAVRLPRPVGENPSPVPAPIPALMNRDTLAAYLGISVKTLDRWVRDFGFPRGFRVNEEPTTKRRWSRAAVDAWIRNRSAKVNGGPRNHGGSGLGRGGAL